MRRSALCLLLLPALVACNSKTDTRLKSIEDRLDKIEKQVSQYDAVTLKPGQTGYSLLASGVGRIAVAIADIKPTASGARVMLDFGNPTAARLSGMKARIEWGVADSRGLPGAGADVQSVSFTAPEPLPAGSWHQFAVDLPGVAPDKLAWIRISAFDSGTVDLLSR